MGENMSRDSGQASKTSSDGRHMSKGKRNTPKPTAFENGETVIGAGASATNMEHVVTSSSKTPDICPNLDLSVGSEAENAAGDCKGIFEEPKLCKEDPQETRHLKELLLLHLDLIQQQQENLMAKDKKIQALNQEKETLKCRLERMDRRMSLLKHHTPSETLSIQSAASPSHREEPGLSRPAKRKHSLDPQDLCKRFSATPEGDVRNSSSIEHVEWAEQTDTPSKRSSSKLKRMRSRFSNSHCEDHEEISLRSLTDREEDISNYEVNRNFNQKSRGPRRSRALGYTDESETEDECSRIKRLLEEKSVLVRERMRVTRVDEKMLWTDRMYHVPTQQPCEQVPVISPKKPMADEVQVPSFRVKHVPTGYQLEGTENLTDDAFAKRHQKPEAEEKRRKRWDMQRLREQNLYEKLQQGRNGERHYQVEGDMEDVEATFLQDPTEAKFIEVQERVPVNAFGFSIPCMKPTEFSLSWFDLERREREDKRTPGRARRK